MFDGLVPRRFVVGVGGLWRVRGILFGRGEWHGWVCYVWFGYDARCYVWL